MEDLLILRTLNGEVAAVFSETGDSAVYPGFEKLAAQGVRIISYRGTEVPWKEFVEQKTDSFNHRFLWDSTLGDPENLVGVLSSLHD